jgi:hypothetical protein
MMAFSQPLPEMICSFFSFNDFSDLQKSNDRPYHLKVADVLLVPLLNVWTVDATRHAPSYPPKSFTKRPTQAEERNIIKATTDHEGRPSNRSRISVIAFVNSVWAFLFSLASLSRATTRCSIAAPLTHLLLSIRAPPN